MSVKINSFKLKDVKRVKAVTYTPTNSGLTVIGGKNGQGKTSILDAIAWALGGAKFEPSMATREGSYNPPKLEVKLSNGLVVTRSGAKSTLKVLDPEGKKSGQRILDSFIGELALDLPKFMSKSDKEKAEQLLSLLGVEDELTKLEGEYQAAYSERHSIGQIATRKEKHAQELEGFDGVPAEPISALELIQKQQDILLTNAENQKKRENVEWIEATITSRSKQIEELQKQLEQAMTERNQAIADLEIAQKDVATLQDESTEELEQQIRDVDEINRKVRANQEREKALEEAADFKQQYDDLTKQLTEIKDAKTKLLENVEMPLHGLTIVDGVLNYNGREWDCMSGAEQLKVSAAIVRALNPNCGFVLMDKLEQMDLDTMNEFGQWLESQNLQVIATRVTTNADECSIIISDGYIDGETVIAEEVKVETETTDWGEF